ncbi:SLC13 family permease [Paraburkholderia sp. BCC1884]|uniref:SLC13 family permease n=1 Tax=Paraburkholderia sp. BCC1884 TaxID=2562668 RepID=UPI00118312CB|nr:SLC13 family permease [Paraburkholderia sp. BCC1884]
MSIQPDIAHAPTAHKRSLHPILMMLGILLIAMALTYLLDAGQFQRHQNLVEPGSYQRIEKTADPLAIFALSMPASTAARAYPASALSLFRAIPDGLTRTSSLIFMVMFVGGMFEVFKRTGALDAGLDRLVSVSRGNMYVLAPLLILTVGLGSTFLGLMSEYLVLLPVVLALGERLKISPMLSLAMLAFGAKLGYVASVSNPIVLPVAQSIAGVPLFSGAGVRLIVFAVAMAIAIAYFLYQLRLTRYEAIRHTAPASRMATPHRLVLLVMGLATVVLVFAAREFKWHNGELSAFYIFLGIAIAVTGRLGAREAADAFVQGMKGMMLAALLIGLAATIELVLQRSMVLDTVIERLSELVNGHPPAFVASGIMVIEAVLDLLVPSTSGKAAISMPILAPIAHLAGLSGQTVVLAFLLGNGIMGIVNPASGLTLAFLAISRVGYGQWVRFALPLVLIMSVAAVVIVTLATEFGY